MKETLPEEYGFLGGLLGTAPDEFQRGSVLDTDAASRDEAVRAGAAMGYPIGVALQIAPIIKMAMNAYGSLSKAKSAVDAFIKSNNIPVQTIPAKTSGGLSKAGKDAVAAYEKAKGTAPPESALYAGHNPDGGGVQLHSSGTQYPYVIGSREGGDLKHFVLDPAGAENHFATGIGAAKYANAAARVRNIQPRPPRSVYGDLPTRTVNLTNEDRPGAMWMDTSNWSDADKAMHASSASWAGPNANDILLDATQYRQKPMVNSSGSWTGSNGVTENNKMTISLPEVPYDPKTNLMTGQARSEMDALAKYRGLFDAQEATAYHSLFPSSHNGVAPAVVIKSSAQPTGQQLGALSRGVDNAGLGGHGVTATEDGALVFPFPGTIPDPRNLQRVASNMLQRPYSGRVTPTDVEMGYAPGAAAWGEGGNMRLPNPGEATGDMLDMMRNQHPDFVKGLGEDPTVLSRMRERIVSEPEMPARIQETRKFMASGDLARVTEMIRKGWAPAAALAALGYDMNAMAEER